MATMMAPVGGRDVLRCDNCQLAQFRSSIPVCKRCRKPLDTMELKPLPGPVLVTDAVTETRGVQVARAVKELRQRSNLSQRELATRMGVPRTYISKIENEKAMPTLGSLDRLAAALEVHVSVLLQDEDTRACEESALLLEDPFLAELLPFIRKMDEMQRSIFLNQAHELCVRKQRRTA